jgi:uncharacterized membrane protein
MTWRRSTTPWDRVFASLPYLLPLMDGIIFFSGPFFNEFPQATLAILPLAPLLSLYTLFLGLFSFGGLGLGGLIILFLLYGLVVRNESISHFIRFNTMQSILFGIGLSLFGIIWSLLQPVFSDGFVQTIFFNFIFFAAVIATVYSIIQSALGRYAEIPSISDAVYMQVR